MFFYKAIRNFFLAVGDSGAAVHGFGSMSGGANSAELAMQSVDSEKFVVCCKICQYRIPGGEGVDISERSLDVIGVKKNIQPYFFALFLYVLLWLMVRSAHLCGFCFNFSIPASILLYMRCKICTMRRFQHLNVN